MNTALEEPIGPPPTAAEMRAAEYHMSPEKAVSDAIDDMADMALHGSVRREVTIQYLRDRGAAIQAGDMSHVKRILAAQVTLLERLFRHLVTRASKTGGGAEHYERYMRLAMRAQAQCMRTAAIIEHLGKNTPPRTAQKASIVEPSTNAHDRDLRPTSHQHQTPVGKPPKTHDSMKV